MIERSDLLGLRSETVRRSNLSAIVRELHAHGPLSRSELVARTGLTRGGIRALIGELVAGNLVTEERSAPMGMPGRPSPLVRPNPEGAVVLALEIAVGSIAVAVVGLGGRLLYRSRTEHPGSRFSVDETVADLAELAQLALARPEVRSAMIGVGVAIVGIVRRADGFVPFAPNIEWHNVSLGSRLAEALDIDLPISVANEVDLGALAEHRRGAAIGCDNVLYVSGDIGVGGGLIVDGRPLTGVAGYAGEVGHLPVNPDGLPCACGGTGCWETEIGERALLRRAGHPSDGGKKEVDAVVTDAAAGDPVALAAMDGVGHWLGFGLAGLVNVLNPRLIVLGGLLGRIYPFVADTLRAELGSRALPASRDLVRVVPAMLGLDASLLGAAELAFEPLLVDPASWLRPRRVSIAVATA